MKIKSKWFFKTATFIAILGMSVLYSFPGGLPEVNAQTGSVTGVAKLSDGSTAAPAGTTVILMAGFSANPRESGARATTTTDAGGNFTFSSLNPDTYYAFVMANATTAYANSEEKEAVVTDGVTTNVGNVALQNAQIQGTLTLSDGTSPVDDERVEVHTGAGDVWVSDYTDSNGKYTIGGLPDGTFSWEIQLDHHNGYNRPQGQSVTITSGGTIQTINASLISAPKTISGRVTRGDGTPVNQASVQACPEMRSLSCVSDHTDANGDYSLTLAPSDWTLDVGPDLSDSTADWVYYGFPETIKFTADNSAETITKNYTVTKADARVTGSVMLDNGVYTINSDIHCLNSEGRGTVRKTDGAGIFNFAIPAGSYECSVFALDSQRDIFPQKKVTVKSGETKDLGTFQGQGKTAHITGIARLSDSRTVRGVDVVAWQKDGVGKERSVSGDGGVFDLTVVPGTWIVGIENGHSYYFYDALKEIKLTSANQTVSGLEIQVAQNETWINGSLKDENGNVVTDASGSIYIRDDAGHKFTGDIDASGSYNIAAPSQIFSGDINNLYGSKVYLGAMLSPNVSYTFKNEIETTLQRNMTIDITAERDAEAIMGNLKNSSGNNLSNITSPIWIIATDGKGNLKSTTVESDGSYRITLSDGKWNVGYQITGEGTDYINKFPKPDPMTVGVGATATKDISVLIGNATIRGTLKDVSGNVVSRAAVFASNHKAVEGTDGDVIKVTTETDDQGVFVLDVVGGNTYQIGAGIPPEESGTGVVSPSLQEVAPAVGAEVTVTLQFIAANTKISGTVRYEGQAVGSGHVQARTEEGGSTSTDINLDGTYTLDLTQNEDWSIQAAEISGSNLIISGITPKIPTSIQESLDLDLSMTDFVVPPPEVKIFNAEDSQAVALYDGTTLNIPAGAFDDSGEVTLTVSPTIDLVSQEQAKSFPVGYEFEVKDSDNKTVRSFRQPVAVSFQYTDQGLQDLGTEEGQIDPSYWDEVNQVMTSTGFAVPSEESNSVMVYTDHFTTFALTSPSMTGTGARRNVVSEKSLVLTPASAGGPNVRIVDETGKQQGSIMAYASTVRGEIKSLGADINGDGIDEVITAPGAGLGPHVRAFKLDKTDLGSFFAYDKGFRKGVNVARGDVNGDGDDEIIVSAMAGGSPNIRVYDYNKDKKQFSLLGWFWAYSQNYRTGVNVASGDVNGDGKEEIIVAPTRDGGPNMRVYQYNSSNSKIELLDWTFAYQQTFKGGVNIACGDIDNNGSDEIVTGPASQGGANIRAYRYNSSTSKLELVDWVLAYQGGFKGGVNIATGDVNGDKRDEIVVAPVQNGGPNIRILSYSNNDLKLSDWFWAYDSKFRGGVNLVVADMGGDGTDEIITATNRGTPNIRVYKGNGDLVDWFWGFSNKFKGGVNLSSGHFE